MPGAPVPPALIRDLGKAYCLSELYPVTHPTLEQALEKLERDLLALGGELHVDVEPTRLRVGMEWAAYRSAHVTRFAARLAEHGVHSFTFRVEGVHAVDLGRFLSAAALPVRVVQAAGGFLAALGAAGTRGILVNGISPAPREAVAQRERQGGVKVDAAVWSAHEVYELVRETAARAESESLDELRRQLVSAPEAERVPLMERLRQVARWMVEKGRPEEVVELVLRMRRDAEVLAQRAPAQRGQVMLAIQKVASRPVIDLLVSRLGKAREDTERAELQAALLHVGAEVVSPLVRALADASDVSARRAYRDALVALERVGIPVLRDMLGDERWFVVRNTVNILGEIRSAESLEHFAWTIQHPDARVRRETVVALTKLGGAEAVPFLVHALNDPDAGIRGSAALGLGLTHVPAAVVPLLARLGQENESEVETEIVRALGRLHDVRALPVLEERAGSGGWLSRRPVAMRVEAIRALGMLGGTRAREVLQGLAGDRAPEIRVAVQRALKGEPSTEAP
ncbi:MAG TPA: HEAT repeat domain-containing protein [Longimicrobiaceae bacterium]|nr:HEAT repeat domain-containing protein [Longimicrobiaceae bacterium]